MPLIAARTLEQKISAIAYAAYGIVLAAAVAIIAGAWFEAEQRLAVICTVSTAACLLILFIVRRTRAAILRPLVRLTQTADRIGSEHCYAARVAKDSDDELGAMIDAFNRMLSRLERHAAELERDRAQLDACVNTRTAELQDVKDQLQSAVSERHVAEAAFMDARDNAEAAERASSAKSQFLANVSREVRTLMSSVLGMVELLLASAIDARQRRYAESIRRSSETLLDVFNGVLDLSKIEAGRMELEAVEFDCKEIIADVTRQLKGRAESKALRLTYQTMKDVPPVIIGDPSRIKQVLLTLVGNAIKFTDRGEVGIRLRVAQREDKSYLLHFQVNDTGVGIAPEAHTSIFEAFSQVDGATLREHAAGGLGLAIAKQVAQLMGGGIGVESTPGRGSTFWFTVRVSASLRAALDETAAIDEEPAATRRFAGRVVLAENDALSQEFAVAMLETTGVETIIARNGEEAITAAAGGGIDLIFMDCQMAIADGYAAVRAIRRSQPPEGSRIPIVALTANSLDGDRDRCLAAGVDDILAKPFKPLQLLAMLSRWLPDAAQVTSEMSSSEQPPLPPAAVTLEIGAIDQIRSLGGGRAEQLLDKIVGLYCDSVPQMLISMHDAARRGDYVALQLAAKALKTSSQNVGAMRFADLCQDLEVAARSGSIRFERLAALECEFDSVLSKLKRVA